MVHLIAKIIVIKDETILQWTILAHNQHTQKVNIWIEIVQ